ncbi:MAG TPA: RidA family protein [Clostridia bacterium]|nr:RidA family protein [Clostridia bacterium]
MRQYISTDKAPGAIGPYSQAVQVRDLIFTSGQIPLNPETGNVEGNGIEEQTERVLKNLAEILKAADSSLDHIIKTTCYLSDMNDFAKFNACYARYITCSPARSCVAVRALPKSVLVEIEAIALRRQDV